MKSSESNSEFDTSKIYGEPYEPCYLARRLEQIAVSIFYDLNAKSKLTPIQYAALNAIRDYPDHEQRVIARVIAVDRSTINGVTSRLAAAGLVIRKRAGRSISLSLTAKGIRMLDEGTTNDVLHAELFLAPLTEKQREQFLGLLRKVVEGNNRASRSPMERPVLKAPED